MTKPPSPCIGVCKFKRAGHCIGCSMTRDQKSMYKALKKGRHRAAFLRMLLGQQDAMGRYAPWRRVYARKCAKKSAPVPWEGGGA